jgi:hypothetical protein
VRQNGWLLSRSGRSLPANASGFDTHRDSISCRFDCRHHGQSLSGKKADVLQRVRAVSAVSQRWRAQSSSGDGVFHKCSVEGCVDGGVIARSICRRRKPPAVTCKQLPSVSEKG